MSGAALNADGRLGMMLTELRLPTMKRLAIEVCDQSDREGWPARRLLESLLEHEMAEREVRRSERHRATSCLSPDKRLSSFDFAAVPTISRAQIMALTEGHEWLDRGANILAFGASGVGKSHLLSGIGHALSMPVAASCSRDAAILCSVCRRRVAIFDSHKKLRNSIGSTF